MSTPDRPPAQGVRPRQVTLAAWLVMAASVMLVLSVFEQLSQLRSLETTTAIEEFLSEPPGNQLGLGRESVLTIMRTVSMVAAGLATAAVILGWHVLRRSRSARVALTVVAVPLFLSGLLAGGFLASVVLASVAMLWLAPSRHWFAGTTSTTGARGAGQSATRADLSHPPPPSQRPLPPPLPPASGSSEQPPPWSSHGGPAPWGAPVSEYREVSPGPGRPERVRRPTSVVVACVITWTCCALTVLLSLTLVAALVSDAEGLFAEMQRRNPDLGDQAVSNSTLESLTWTIGIVCLVWALASATLAVLAFNRSRWAAIALVVSAGAVALFCLAGSLVSPPLVVPGVLAAVAAVLLLQPSSQRWLAGRQVPRPGGMM